MQVFKKNNKNDIHKNKVQRKQTNNENIVLLQIIKNIILQNYKYIKINLEIDRTILT